MHLTYLDYPLIPTEIEQQILYLADNPIRNYHSSEEFLQAAQNRSDLNINASSDIVSALQKQEYNPNDSLGFHLSEVWNHFTDLAEFDFLEVSENVRSWVEQYFPKKVDHVSIQSMYGGTTITPHIDEMRTYAFNYVITTGGQAETVFWKPKKEYSHLKSYPQTVFPYDRLEVLDRIVIESKKWHRLDTSTIHSVENLDPLQRRISLSLSML